MSLLLVLLAAAQAQLQARNLLERCNVEEATPRRASLPGDLNEISGLTFGPDGRLLAHDDESGVIFAIDTANGAIVARFELGPSVPSEDFEGIELVGERLFLTTSDGVLFETRVVGDGERIAFQRVDTGLGRWCEVEGLGAEAGGILLFACKQPRRRELNDQVAIFRWDPTAKTPADPARFVITEKALERSRNQDRFRPGGIARDPLTGHLVLISAQDNAIAEITPAGAVVGVARLRGHGQAEGIAISADGRLWIADEGNRTGMLSVYACR
jgi:uncharacterized protein YjiK